MLASVGGGAGMLALQAMMSEERARATEPDLHAPREPHYPSRASRVIWLFMHGGPSHVDLFDFKPDLVKYAGKPVPESFGNVMTRRNVAKNPLLGPIKPFRKRAESGLEISEFLPHIAEHADRLCVIRSMHGDSVNHPQSVYQMNTGNILMGHPSVGSWIAYGLGTLNRDMPAFVVLPDPGGGLKGGPPAWGSGYLPASYQGMTMRPGEAPILNLAPQPGISQKRQGEAFAFLQDMNGRFVDRIGEDDELQARIAAYELAFRMQAAAPALVDISQETEATHRLYGLENKETAEFGRRCLLARRMIEQGVRFVQVHSGNTLGWDAHKDVLSNHTEYCGKTDLPVAGLLTDLAQRGLLDDTLVIWCGEFGRMPMSEQGKGRDHNPWGYCSWLAGAGIEGGRAIGATDPIGLRAAEDKVHVRDFHATLLHLMGIDHMELSYFHNGLEERLTGPQEAHVVEAV
ncbi:MAG: DUF1501 domain-containing protein [Planctomycetota bacterium]|nr:DUF1501 domain-containing protein [Planctomycetota bacterium]